ncbi:hypothetical protein [Bacillus kexueae]|uniref:hypothetical protein n=1 Tax=Aeribacillus kexueae TaxID=2078952 RepID=UPI001FAFA991|nr:hypothetical protein [Bacillus kexueae]
MIFFYFTCSLILLLAGIIGLTMTASMAQTIIFILFIVIGIGLLFYTFHQYQKRRNKENESVFDCITFTSFPDCQDVSIPKKGVDCDCINL